MHTVIKQLETEPFSDKEILKAVEGKANLVLYPDISKYRTIDQLLGRNRACFILYITNDNGHDIYGHWVCIYQVGPNNLEFFDPYAYIFDSQLSFGDNKTPPYLTRLLENCNYNIGVNTHILQARDNKNISTCGRHCACRINMRSIPLADYANLLMSELPNITPDEQVSKLTAFIK
jgi:hypothetical protein